MPSTPLQNPARYVTPVAVSFVNPTGESDVVTAANPLPVSFASAQGGVLSGQASSSTLLGPLSMTADRAVMLTLSGTWTGEVRILRSTDGGVTKLGVTALGQPYGIYTANLCEPVWEESEQQAALYLNVTLTSGTLVYRMGQ